MQWPSLGDMVLDWHQGKVIDCCTWVFGGHDLFIPHFYTVQIEFDKIYIEVHISIRITVNGLH